MEMAIAGGLKALASRAQISVLNGCAGYPFALYMCKQKVHAESLVL